MSVNSDSVGEVNVWFEDTATGTLRLDCRAGVWAVEAEMLADAEPSGAGNDVFDANIAMAGDSRAHERWCWSWLTREID